MQRLLDLSHKEGGGLGLVWGRRRVGKTRLLLERVQQTGGVNTVADQSAPAVQRRYWKGNGPEWDVVAASLEEDALLLGGVRWCERPLTASGVRDAGQALLARGVPSERWAHSKRVVPTLFVPRVARDRGATPESARPSRSATWPRAPGPAA